MDGEVSSLIQALLIMCIATIAFAGAIGGIASKYSVQKSPYVDSIVNSTGGVINASADWAANTRNSTTTNEWSNVFQLTSGTFAILADIMFSIPAMFNSIIDAFVGAIFVPLASYCSQEAPDCVSGLQDMVGLAIKTLLLLTVVFAAVKAITKVSL